MGESALPKAGKWYLRSILIFIGIMTWILGICIIVGYSYAFFDDLRGVYKDESLFRASGQRDYILTVLNRAIDDGMIGMCDFSVWDDGKRSSGDGPAPGKQRDAQAKTKNGVGALPDAQSPDRERVLLAKARGPSVTKVNRERCEASLSAERNWQRTQLHHDKWTIFASVENPIQRVFVVLDLLMIALGCLAGIVGYLLIHGAVWKRRKHLVPWLLLSFTVAYGPVFYGAIHIVVQQGFDASSANSLNIGFIVAFCIIAVVLHGVAFYAVAKFFMYLWKPEGEPEYPNKMKLVLNRT